MTLTFIGFRWADLVVVLCTHCRALRVNLGAEEADAVEAQPQVTCTNCLSVDSVVASRSGARAYPVPVPLTWARTFVTSVRLIAGVVTAQCI